MPRLCRQKRLSFRRFLFFIISARLTGRQFLCNVSFGYAHRLCLCPGSFVCPDHLSKCRRTWLSTEQFVNFGSLPCSNPLLQSVLLHTTSCSPFCCFCLQRHFSAKALCRHRLRLGLRQCQPDRFSVSFCRLQSAFVAENGQTAGRVFLMANAVCLYFMADYHIAIDKSCC